jgi:hypothetical protein
MTGARRRASLVGGLAIIAVLLLFAVSIWHGHDPMPARPASQRPTLLLLTTLPLVFGEDFSTEHTGSPALKALQSRYRVVPISVTDPAELAKGRVLLMAQPQAQPAEDLVALDRWVRRGGRVLLLADPVLEWPSDRPLGDALRPPPMFMEMGLLSHWGLRLDAPDRPGEREGKLGGFGVVTESPGLLSGTCPISADRLVAHCSIGKGRATVVADADLLDIKRLGPNASRNLDDLLGELASLESV